MNGIAEEPGIQSPGQEDMMKRMALIVALIAAAAICFGTLPAAASALTLNKYEAQILKLVNAERAKRDLAPVGINGKLTKAARAHSAEMAAKRYFAHNSANGERWSSRLIRFGYTPSGCRYWKVGENIFWGGGLAASPVNVVDRWMASTAHRQVILTRAFRGAGIGAVRCDAGYGSCNGPVWFFTLDLGRRILL